MIALCQVYGIVATDSLIFPNSPIPTFLPT